MSYQPIREISSAKKRVQGETEEIIAVCEEVIGDHCYKMLD